MADSTRNHDLNSSNIYSSTTYDDLMDAQPYNTLKTTDRLLPIANISKIMKAPIPKVAKVAKDAKELMQKAASEFIAIVTCMAKEICESENRKTLTGEDLIRAMDSLGMPYYAELTKKYFAKYKDSSKHVKTRRGMPMDGHGSMNL